MRAKFAKAEMYHEEFSCISALYKDERLKNELAPESYPLLTAFRERLTKHINNGNGTETNMQLLKNAYCLSGQEYFDDFMIAIEWNRPVEERFWLPRRKKLLPVAQALQELEYNELDELFLSMPPRIGKSSIIMFFVLWCILRDSERSNLYCSYTDAVVTVFYNGILEILNDPVTYCVRDVFPDFKIASTNAKDLLINIDRKKRYASFTGRSLYGTLNGACDCNGYEIADDLHSGIEEALNKDRLKAAWDKVDNNFLPRAKEGAKRLWIGTRWAQSDCIARRIDLLENDERMKGIRYRILNLPALDENDESNFDYSCGVGFSTEYYLQRRASFEKNNDIASWDAQYQGCPIERSGAVFAPEDLRFYNGVLPEATPDRIFMAVDPAWGGGDFVAAPVIFQYGDDLFVADVVYSNADKKLTQALLAHAIIKYGVQAVKIEATKMTKDYADGVNKLLKEKNHKVNMITNVKHFTGSGKQQRIFDKAPDIRESMIFLESDKRSKEYNQFMNNVYSFKVVGKNTHDDAPDSLAMAIDMAFRSVKSVEIRQRKYF